MNFNLLCENFLQDLAIIIEKKDENSNLEIDYLDGILKIKIIKNSKVFVINRNSGNQKIWYSSPVSGADYFAFDEVLQNWLNAKKIELTQKLLDELKVYFN